MKLSVNWLKRYLNIGEMSMEQLSDILTTIGLEVEGEERVETIKGGLKGIKIGKVLTCEKHPDADRLSITTVDVGGEAPLNIVCGAPNVAADQKVVVATIGTTLYNGDEPWKIKKGKIRGVVSEGMICAEDELGLGSSHDGIMVLPEDTAIGMDAAEYFEVSEDVVFEIGLTPNRSDATSHLGVARDVYAYITYHGLNDNIYLKSPAITNDDYKHDILSVPVEVKNKTACRRYTSCTITDVTVKPSPSWMQDLLRSIGVKPKNNIVDITNFVLHELGQPLHAFDAEKIGSGIVVQNLPKDSKFLALDNTEKVLSDEDLMICNDQSKGLCIAGVYGGLDSGVTESTTKIFLESACFDASTIRKTSTRHLLRTDAAKVYEKGADPAITEYALKRAADLMVEFADAKIASRITDIQSQPIEKQEIIVRYNNVRRLLGVDIPKDDIHSILRALDMELQSIDESKIRVKVPTNKVDVVREIDIIEEILRIYGFNKIEIPEKVSTTLQVAAYPTKQNIKEKVCSFLTNRGFAEMMGLSLIKSGLYDTVRPEIKDQLVFINNTSNISLDIMRPEMLMSGLLSVTHNLNRQNNDLRLYEIGRCYLKAGEDFNEEEYLTLFMTGNRSKESWQQESSASVDFYDIKGEVLELLQNIGFNSYQLSEIEEDDRYLYGLKVHQGPNTVATFGEVAPAWKDQAGIKSAVFFAEIKLKSILKKAQKTNITTTEIGKYPSSRKDIAFVIDASVSYKALEGIIRKAGGKTVSDVNLFDVYTSEEHLGKDKKSYAISMVLGSKDKTLSEKEIDKILSKIITNAEKEVGAVVRK